MFKIFSDAFSLFRSSFKGIFFIVFSVLVIQFGILYFGIQNKELFGNELINDTIFLLIKKSGYLIYSSATVYFINGLLKDLYLSPLTCIKKALMAFPLLSLPFIPVLFCIRSGIIYLVILGLFLGAKLSFAFFDILLNIENPISAVKKSFISTEGYTLQLIQESGSF